jgi:membrane protease YdiL (CAAX protease family)
MYNKLEQRGLRNYFFFTYLLFWILIGVIGFLISLDVPALYQTILKNVCAWTPTFVILLMFKKLYPNTHLRDFFKSNFLGKTKPRYFIIIFLSQTAIFLGIVLVYMALNNLRLESIPFISASGLVPALLITATGGALGEELGWRAYALNVFQKKYSPLKSALFVGLVWGFWHLPLMIFSGYSGLELLYYCFFFLMAVLSLSVVITFFYNKGRSVLIAIWIHFLFNFSIALVTIDVLQLMIYLSAGYLLLAIILLITNKKELLSNRNDF